MPLLHRRSRRRRPARKRALLATVVVLTAVLLAAALYVGVGGGKWFVRAGPEGVPGRWTAALQDDFSGGSLDTSLWQPDRYGGSGGDAPFNPDKEAAWFSPDNVAVAGGQLTLTVREQTRTLLGRDYPLSSGMVQSPEHLRFQRGTYAEARVEVPRCDGCWPAFWLVPTDTWPPEIDCFEFFNSELASESRPEFNYYRPNGDQAGPSPYGRGDVDYRGEFHTYGVLWGKDAVTPYVDGIPYPQVAATGDITEHPMALVLNLSVMAGHQPPPGSQMRVDWVRVWAPEHGGSGQNTSDPVPRAPEVPSPALLPAVVDDRAGTAARGGLPRHRVGPLPAQRRSSPQEPLVEVSDLLSSRGRAPAPP